MTGKTLLVVERKHDAIEPPVEQPPSEVTEQVTHELLEAVSTEPPSEQLSAAESTIVAQLPEAAARHSHELSSAVAASVEHVELLVKRPPGKLLVADITQQAAAIAAEQSVSVPAMVGLLSASAAVAGSNEGDAEVDSHLSVDRQEWIIRLPTHRCVV